MQLLINALIAGSLAALIAGGLALVYGVMGVFNMALGQMALFGGYITWWLHVVAGVPLLIAIVGGLIGSAILSGISFELFVRPFTKRHQFLPLVTTIALSMLLDGLLLLLFEERPRSILGGSKQMIDLGTLALSIEQAALIVGTILLLCIFAYTLHSLPIGRKIRSVVQHDHAARSLGINAPFLHAVLFIVSGVLAGGAGIFLGMDQNLTPTLGFALTIKGYAAVIAGGKGSVWGAVLAAYLIALLEQIVIGVHWFGGFYVPAGYQSAIPLLFIILLLLLRPTGLFASTARTA